MSVDTEKWRADFSAWKAKRGYKDSQKVFCCVGGGYRDVRKSLRARGWVENKEPCSDFFDFKWTLKATDIREKSLHPPQIVNHYEKSFELTTKTGLVRSVSHVKWLHDINSQEFFPRAYNLSSVADVACFQQDFQWTAAKAILLRTLQDRGFTPGGVPSQAHLDAAMQVCDARIAFSRDLVEEDIVKPPPEMTDADWDLVLRCPCFDMKPMGTPIMRQSRKKASAKSAPPAAPVKTPPMSASSTESSALSADLDGCCAPCAPSTPAPNGSRATPAPIPAEAGTDLVGSCREAGPTSQDGGAEEATPAPDTPRSSGEGLLPISHDMTCHIRDILKLLSERDAQDSLDGPGNVWILKPGSKSRGRGIVCFNNWHRLSEYLAGLMATSDQNMGMNIHQWMVQKYIERPLIIHKRKFDIRQWVLVSGWSPLTVWFYEECYARFCAEDYRNAALDNRFMHLANNSISKHSSKHKTDFLGSGNMWGCGALQKHLQERAGYDVFNEVIKPKLKLAAQYALAGARDLVVDRKNSFELYGYDFMLDEQYHVWLIEVNSSPTMEHSTKVTSRMCRQLGDDIVKLVVDAPAQHSAVMRGLKAQQRSKRRSKTKPRASKEQRKGTPPAAPDEHSDDADAGELSTTEDLDKASIDLDVQDSDPPKENKRMTHSGEYSETYKGIDTGRFTLICRAWEVDRGGGPVTMSSPLLLEGTKLSPPKTKHRGTYPSPSRRREGGAKLVKAASMPAEGAEGRSSPPRRPERRGSLSAVTTDLPTSGDIKSPSRSPRKVIERSISSKLVSSTSVRPKLDDSARGTHHGAAGDASMGTAGADEQSLDLHDQPTEAPSQKALELPLLEMSRTELPPPPSPPGTAPTANRAEALPPVLQPESSSGECPPDAMCGGDTSRAQTCCARPERQTRAPIWAKSLSMNDATSRSIRPPRVRPLSFSQTTPAPAERATPAAPSGAPPAARWIIGSGELDPPRSVLHVMAPPARRSSTPCALRNASMPRRHPLTEKSARWTGAVPRPPRRHTVDLTPLHSRRAFVPAYGALSLVSRMDRTPIVAPYGGTGTV